MQKEIQIEVNTKPYGEFKLYQRKNFTFYPGITSLVGCNGSGKSTLLKGFIEPQLRAMGTDYIEWDDRSNGGYHLMDKYLNFDDDIQGVAAMALSSEGERIVYALGDIFAKMGSGIRRNSGKRFAVLFDAIDSGMSVDEIIEIRNIFFDTIFPDAEKHNTELYVIIAANNYEWCADSRINNMNITTGKSIEISSYEDFRTAILKSRAIKDKSRE